MYKSTFSANTLLSVMTWNISKIRIWLDMWTRQGKEKKNCRKIEVIEEKIKNQIKLRK